MLRMNREDLLGRKENKTAVTFPTLRRWTWARHGCQDSQTKLSDLSRVWILPNWNDLGRGLWGCGARLLSMQAPVRICGPIAWQMASPGQGEEKSVRIIVSKGIDGSGLVQTLLQWPSKAGHPEELAIQITTEVSHYYPKCHALRLRSIC